MQASVASYIRKKNFGGRLQLHIFLVKLKFNTRFLVLY